jgi:predicted regulator of Ras-like GTPase activity (Roadblock/LC7/MglB family)
MTFQENRHLSGSAKLSDLLTQLNQRGGFLFSVLTDQAGFPVAYASAPSMEPEIQAAVAALINKVAGQTHKVDIGEVDEISVFDSERRRLVCRTFQTGSHRLILAVMVEENNPYRRLTNSAIRAIREAWKV